MPVTLALSARLLNLGAQVRLTASCVAPQGSTEVIVSIGVQRPDGQTEYPVWMQRFIITPPTSGQPPPTVQNTAGALYTTKMMGWHKTFAQIFVYSNSTIIGNELTPLQNFFVGPTIGIVIPTSLPT